MTIADRLNHWNRWFDATPEEWHGHILLWPLAFAGFVNMQLTIASGFPFGVLVLLGLAAIGAVRLPYKRGWIIPGPTEDEGARFLFGHADWLYELNQRYEALPGVPRFFIIPGILIAGGTANLVLTFTRGWAFGGVFLAVLLAVILLRAPFAWGVLPAPEKLTEGPLARAWLHDVNRWYDEMPEERRFWTATVALGVVCIINLLLVSRLGAPLALLFLLELLALIGLRAPYVSGAVESPTRRLPPAAPRQIAADVVPPLSLGLRQTISADEVEADSAG
jgi:hypothetical protein